MKSAVLYKTNEKLEMTDLEMPKPNYGQVLVKIAASGICRSQLNEIKAHKGPDNYLPHTLGHEAAGYVQDIGEGVTKVKEGDYVVLTWIKGKGCDVNSFEYQRKDGMKINSGAVTTFNEYSIVSENRTVKIDEKVPPDIASLLGCAVPTGVGIIKNDLNVKKNESVGIFGAGGIGSCAVIGAKLNEAYPIVAIDINEDKLNQSKKLGATHTINPMNEEVSDKIFEITEGKKLDYSVDCSGIIEMIETGFDTINDKGTLIIAGNPAQNEKIKLTPFEFIKGKKIIGSWGGGTDPDIDIPYYAEQYLKGNMNLDVLVRKYKFEDINQALSDLDEGKMIRGIIEF